MTVITVVMTNFGKTTTKTTKTKTATATATVNRVGPKTKNKNKYAHYSCCSSAEGEEQQPRRSRRNEDTKRCRTLQFEHTPNRSSSSSAVGVEHLGQSGREGNVKSSTPGVSADCRFMNKTKKMGAQKRTGNKKSKAAPLYTRGIISYGIVKFEGPHTRSRELES